MIQFSCDCGQKLKVDDKYAGKKIRCPKCKEVAVVPADEDLAAAISSTEPTRKMRSPDSAEFDFKSLPKLKALDDLVDLEDDDESEEGDEDSGPVAAPPASSKIFQVLAVFCALIGLSGAVGAGMVLIPPVMKGVKAGEEMPQEFEVFSVDEGFSFSIEYPKGWTLESGGGSGGKQDWVKITHGSIVIDFRTSTAGAAIAGYGVQNPNQQASELEPVHEVHRFFKEHLQAEDSSYEEEDPDFVRTGFGSSRLSVFTSGGFFGKRFGYRLTALGSNDQWTGNAYCSSQRKFDQYRDLLRKVMLSVGPGK